MLSKLNCSSRLLLGAFAILSTLGALPLQGAGVEQTNHAPIFLGATTCSSSGCHGGGGEHQNQYLVWSLRDFHSQRPVATLTTARSKQIADSLQIKDPTAESRCTTCHAPLRDVPGSLRGGNFKVSEGVSCESCHGPAENWLRSHTRHDYTTADRVAAGMRDLKNLYVRANTCVACHQNVDSDLLAAGHPELIFELDGQSVSEPKHWREATNWNGAQTWLVGQAVALREMSWQLAREKSPGENQLDRWSALLWVIETAMAGQPSPSSANPSYSPTAENLANVQRWSDEIASRVATDPAANDRMLKNLANGTGDFRDKNISAPVQARRAERLVLALDRLVDALPELNQNESAQSALKQLFADAQSRPDFDPSKFAGDLDKFSQALK